MPHFSDQDGKSTTASAVDDVHYPPVTAEAHEAPEEPALPGESEIAERAYHKWLEKGRPEGTHEGDWLEAERELHDAALSRRLTQIAHEKGGSVQE